MILPLMVSKFCTYEENSASSLAHVILPHTTSKSFSFIFLSSFQSPSPWTFTQMQGRINTQIPIPIDNEYSKSKSCLVQLFYLAQSPAVTQRRDSAYSNQGTCYKLNYDFPQNPYEVLTPSIRMWPYLEQDLNEIKLKWSH